MCSLPSFAISKPNHNGMFQTLRYSLSSRSTYYSGFIVSGSMRDQWINNWLNERIKALWKDKMLLREELLRKPWTWPIVRYGTRALLWLVHHDQNVVSRERRHDSNPSRLDRLQSCDVTQYEQNFDISRRLLAWQASVNLFQTAMQTDIYCTVGLLVLREAVKWAGKNKKPQAHPQTGYLSLEINHYYVCPRYSYYLSIFRRRRSLLEFVDTCHWHNSIEDIRIIERSVLSRDDLDGFLRCNTSNDRCDSVNFSIRIACQLLTNGHRIFLH